MRAQVSGRASSSPSGYVWRLECAQAAAAACSAMAALQPPLAPLQAKMALLRASVAPLQTSRRLSQAMRGTTSPGDCWLMLAAASAAHASATRCPMLLQTELLVGLARPFQMLRATLWFPQTELLVGLARPIQALLLCCCSQRAARALRALARAGPLRFPEQRQGMDPQLEWMMAPLQAS